MKQDLKTAIELWQSKSHIHETKTVHINKSPGVNGEYLLTLTIEVNVTVANDGVRVESNKIFHTLEQLSYDESSHGDCYRFHRTINKLDEEFFDKYEAVLSKLINDNYGNGFVKNPL